MKRIMSRRSLERPFAAFVLNLMAVLFVFGVMLRTHFSQDTFNVAAASWDHHLWHISRGRCVAGALHYVLLRLGLSTVRYADLYTAGFMAVCALCVTQMACVLVRLSGAEEEKQFWICDLALLTSVISISMMEWYMFPESMYLYAVALLCATQAALVFASDKTSAAAKALLSFVFLFLAINCYQAILGWYVALALTCILVRGKFALGRKEIAEAMEVMGVGAVNALLNQKLPGWLAGLGFTGASQSLSHFSLNTIFHNLSGVMDAQGYLWIRGFGLLPRYFLLLSMSAALTLLVLALGGKTYGLRRIFWTGLVLAGGYAMTMIPHLVSSSLWITPRTLVGVFLVLALTLALAALTGRAYVQNMAFLLSAGVLMISSLYIAVADSDHFITNYINISEAKALIAQIDAHEQETGERIEEICILMDEQTRYGFERVTTSIMDMNVRQMLVDWAVEDFIEQVSARAFTFVEPTKQLEEQIVQGRNWDAIDADDQVICEGNRAYLIVY